MVNLTVIIGGILQKQGLLELNLSLVCEFKMMGC